MHIRERLGLHQHLEGNLYPPMTRMLQAAVDAIAYFREGTTDPEAPRPGYVAAPALGADAWVPAEEVVKNLHLEFYLEGCTDDD